MAGHDQAAVTRDSMRADIARALRMAPEELDGADDLGDLGLDSLRAMGLLMGWNDAGVPLEYPDLAETLTLDAWWSAAQRAMSGDAGAHTSRG